MSGFRAAKRYAKGLMDFAVETGNAAQINQEMKDLKKSIQDSRELSSFLNSPVLDSRRKNEIAKEIFKDFSPATKNFIYLVIRQGRERGLKEIASQFQELYNQRNNIRIADVITATDLNRTLVDEILESAKKSIGTQYEYQIQNKIDPSLIGGFILRVGDKQIDASVRDKFNRLKKEFDINDYVPKF